MGQFDALLRPLTIKNLTLRNRIVSTSHAPAYAEGGMPRERYQLYHEEKAKGGLALTMFGGSSVVSPDLPSTFGHLDVSDDRIVPHFQEFARRIHSHGAALMCQITHMGRRTRWDAGNWLPAVAPSPVREPEHRSFPKAMEDWDFTRIIRDFGQAARRCREGGLDGLELSFQTLHLIPQFWSPGTNKRNDRYGGSLENRMRFSFEVLEEVRTQVGPDFILSVRMTVDELIADGLDFKEGYEIAVRLAKSGLVDILNVWAGQARDWRSLSVVMANMAFPVAPFLHLASAVKAAVDIPILHAQRISDVATAARAVSEGHIDLVGLTRAHMADPYLVRKLMEGRPDDIRQCVGANYCIDRIYVGGEALCIQSPATGREATMPHIIARSSAPARKVVVIGAGPAGLEAARVSAERGHKVVLFEADRETGGQVNIAAKATWRESLSGITRWLDGQVRKAGVDLRLGREAGLADVAAEAPEVVIVATGGTPNKGSFKGAELAVTSWDILTGRVAPGENVLLFDDHGGHQGPSTAEFMAKRGALVEIATPERMTGIEIGGTSYPVHQRELYKAGVVFTPDMRLIEIGREGNKLVAVLKNEYSDQEEERLVDQVVAEHGTLSRDALYFDLKAGSRNAGEIDYHALKQNRVVPVVSNPAGRYLLFRVGDAAASRNIHAAIYDSLRICKDL
jgi:2,4-dienoyl-CoA reductase-like NADH-dependent reductase (Old Yellow Enzyme family)